MSVAIALDVFVLARGDVKAVRSLVELGEPYRDNHCKHLEGEIDTFTGELEAAAKKLRELSDWRDQLLSELEQLKVDLPVTTYLLKLHERSA